jgi:hypothetical protein
MKITSAVKFERIEPATEVGLCSFFKITETDLPLGCRYEDRDLPPILQTPPEGGE